MLTRVWGHHFQYWDTMILSDGPKPYGLSDGLKPCSLSDLYGPFQFWDWVEQLPTHRMYPANDLFHLFEEAAHSISTQL